MPDVLILTDSLEDQAQSYGFDAVAQMVSALKQAVIKNPSFTQINSVSTLDQTRDQLTTPRSESVPVVHTVDVSGLGRDQPLGHLVLSECLVCSLTLNLPGWLDFPEESIYQVCRNVDQLRGQVAEWGYSTGSGNFWLPVVLTGKGPLYAEAIAQVSDSPDKPGDTIPYEQPFHLSDFYRQSLYKLGFRLLRLLKAPPSTYLLQFGFDRETICFDRLFPFPATPAIASINVQTPDLYECYWRCLTNQPIFDLLI